MSPSIGWRLFLLLLLLFFRFSFLSFTVVACNWDSSTFFFTRFSFFPAHSLVLIFLCCSSVQWNQTQLIIGLCTPTFFMNYFYPLGKFGFSFSFLLFFSYRFHDVWLFCLQMMKPRRKTRRRRTTRSKWKIKWRVCSFGNKDCDDIDDRAWWEKEA